MLGFITRWFKKSPPDDFEQALALLAKDIQKRQTRLSEIRLRERRATLLLSVYAIVAWIAYTTLWYLGFLPNFTAHGRSSNLEKGVKLIPLFIGPIVVLFVRRIMQMWYTSVGDAEEKALVLLRKQQREKIEEVKQKTNYYSMRNLIERYEDGPSPETPAGLRRRIPPQAQTPQPQLQAPQTAPQTPQRNLQVVSQIGQVTPGLQQQLSPSPQRLLPPPRKQWFDKVADAILGDEDSSTAGAASRYALICQKCFAHNGLVKEDRWEDAQYVCPKCGHFNPSARTVREAREGKRLPTPPSIPGSAAKSNAAPQNALRSTSAVHEPPMQDEGTSMDVDS